MTRSSSTRTVSPRRAAAAGDFFGEIRLADYLARAASDELSPAETVRRLVLRLYEHSPAPLHDDATMLLVNWLRPNGAKRC